MTVSTYLNCCPETVDVTINQTVVTWSDDEIEMYHDYFTDADVVDTGGVLTLTLSHTPISNHQVTLALNSGIQGEDGAGAQHNYTVSGDQVTLHFVPVAGDKFHVWYIGLV